LFFGSEAAWQKRNHDLHSADFPQRASIAEIASIFQRGEPCGGISRQALDVGNFCLKAGVFRKGGFEILCFGTFHFEVLVWALGEGILAVLDATLC